MTAFADLPERLTTSEVCKLARITQRTFRRRILSGRYRLVPIDRGSENLYRKGDVFRVLDIEMAGVVAQGLVDPKDHDAFDVEAYRAAMARNKKPTKRSTEPYPIPEPTTPAQRRAFTLSLRPGIRVQPEDDGRFLVTFVARSNARAMTWPAVTILPRANPGPVTLADDAELDALIGEAIAIRAECRAALNVERGA